MAVGYSHSLSGNRGKKGRQNGTPKTKCAGSPEKDVLSFFFRGSREGEVSEKNCQERDVHAEGAEGAELGLIMLRVRRPVAQKCTPLWHKGYIWKSSYPGMVENNTHLKPPARHQWLLLSSTVINLAK